MEPDPTVAGRVAAIRDEQDPWTRARLAAADLLALLEVFDEAVGTIWQLHVAQRGAADVARTLEVPVSLLLGAITRTSRTVRQPLRR